MVCGVPNDGSCEVVVWTTYEPAAILSEIGEPRSGAGKGIESKGKSRTKRNTERERRRLRQYGRKRQEQSNKTDITTNERPADGSPLPVQP